MVDSSHLKCEKLMELIVKNLLFAENSSGKSHFFVASAPRQLTNSRRHLNAIECLIIALKLRRRLIRVQKKSEIFNS
jgi:hypothetical protein